MTTLFEELRCGAGAVIDHARTLAVSASQSKPGEWRRSHHHQTYFAIIRRNGVFEKKDDQRIDLNRELAEPFLPYKQTMWQEFFDSYSPKCIDEAAGEWFKVLKDMDHESRRQLQQMGAFDGAEPLLRLQFTISENSLKQDFNNAKQKVSQQRKTPKNVIPKIGKYMQPAYDKASDIRGRGKLNMIDLVMRQHLQDVAEVMYEDAAEDLSQVFDQSLRKMKEELLKGLITRAMVLIGDYRRFWSPETQQKRHRRIQFSKKIPPLLGDLEASSLTNMRTKCQALGYATMDIVTE